MSEVLLILLFGAVIFILEGLPLKKKKQKKVFWVFTGILLIGVALYLAMVLDLPIPSPTGSIAAILEPIYQPIAAWIKGGNPS